MGHIKGLSWLWGIIGGFWGLCLTPFSSYYTIHFLFSYCWPNCKRFKGGKVKDRNAFKLNFYSTDLQLFRGDERFSRAMKKLSTPKNGVKRSELVFLFGTGKTYLFQACADRVSCQRPPNKLFLYALFYFVFILFLFLCYWFFFLNFLFNPHMPGEYKDEKLIISKHSWLCVCYPNIYIYIYIYIYKVNRDFLQAVAESVLRYECITWTLTKHIGKS